jgi:hypothetical protein
MVATVGRVKVGTEATRLIVLRGNSGSDNSSVAAEVRARHGRGVALVGQDNLRRVVLRERDVPAGANIGLIEMVARYAISHGFHVIIDGILQADRYGPMLDALHRDHRACPASTILTCRLRKPCGVTRPGRRPPSSETEMPAGTEKSTCCAVGSSMSSPRRTL